MRLRTLGGLTLEGSSLGRPKPLLLLAYLTLEGPRPRRFLAELFWPGAANPTNSIAVAVRQIRQLAPDALHDDEVRLWADLPCDALDLERAVLARDAGAAFELYRGAFLEGAELPEWGAELEEWVYARRERLAAQLREAALEQAEREAAMAHFDVAAHWAERAVTLRGAAEPGPEFWVRTYPLLRAGDSLLAEEVRGQAQGWNLTLNLSPGAARERLRQGFVGRDTEVQRLNSLSAGQWAWVRGGPGLGKTALLRQLGGLSLPARAGLPYATLEPLLGSDLSTADEGALLRRLRAHEGRWLLDSWEDVDEESRALLLKLRRLGTRASVVMASSGEPPFTPDLRLELGPLSETALRPYPGAFAATGGLPALVGAWLRGEPVETALEARLTALPTAAQQVYGALTLLAHPDLPLVRQALGFSAAELAQALEHLLRLGFVEPGGQVRGRSAAQHALNSHPARQAALALSLARQQGGPDAWPLFRQARAHWEDPDLVLAQNAALAWANEALKRGFPRRAADALGEVPARPEVLLLRARALERAGQFRDAQALLVSRPDTPAASALQAALCWRLGQPDQARQHAQAALNGDDEARAEALNTLANLDFQAGAHQNAEKLYRRAATLWLTLGDQARWAGALNNRAVAQSQAGLDAEPAFRDALQAAGENLMMQARVIQNLGQVREQRGDLSGALSAYREAARLSQEAGSLNTAARAWNNLGALHHRAAQLDQARAAYAQALTLAQQVGETLLLGMVLANLAELSADPDAFEEALRLIERSGNPEVLTRYQAEYQAFIARSLGAGQA